MSTTIDSLNIEIQSNSTGAAQGIDALAVSLEKLKNSGKISAAVNNLNGLAAALKNLTPVTSNANKLSALAKSVNELSKAGSFSKVVNQLNKLPSALKGLSSLNVDNSLGAKVSALTQALVPLSQVKTGGLGTMVNSLSKIGKVTASLDDGTITRFTDRVKKLSEALTPLSQKMTTIQTGLRGVNSSAKSAGTGMKQFGTKVNATTLNLASLVTVVQGAISALMPLIRLLSSTISDAMEWDGIEYQFGNTFGEQADMYYQKITEITDALSINKQTFMENSAMASSMLVGFGVDREDAREMGIGYTELAYDIWAAFNNVYKSFDGADGAMAAVRSAIAGEVEPIRRAGFTIVDSQLAITAANHGIAYSSQTATEEMKSYLRYLTLVEQAHNKGIVGTFAKEMTTAEGLVRTLTQQMKSLSQSFGSLFLPILVKVLPWLQAFVDLMTEGIILLASFFGIEIQPVDWSGYSGGFNNIKTDAENAKENVEGANKELENTKKAIEDLKRATIGIDELNVISPPNENSGSGGSDNDAGGGGGGSVGDLDVDSLWDESILSQVKSQVDDIKAKLEEWLPVIGTIGGALAGLGIATLLKNIGDALSQMGLLQKLLATVAIVAIEAALVFTFADNYLESGNLLYLIGEALVTAAAGYLLFKTWGTGGAVLGLSVSIAAQIVAIAMNLADGTVSLSSPNLWTQALVTVLTGALGGAIIAKNTAFFVGEGLVIGLATTLSLTMMAINYGAIASGEIDTDSFESWIMGAISVAGAGMTGFTVGKALKGAAGGAAGLTIGVTVGLVLNLASIAIAKNEDGNEDTNFGDSISDWIWGAITAVSSAITAGKLWSLIGPSITTALSGIGGKITAWLAGGGAAGIFAKIETGLAAIPVWGWIAAAIVALLAGAIGLAIADYDFTDIGEKVGKAIGTGLKWFTPVGWAITIGQWLWDAVEGAIEWFKKFDSFEDFCDTIIEGITSWLDDFDEWWDDFVEAGKNIVEGIKQGISEGWDNLCENLGEFFTGFWDGFCEAFGIASPAKKMKPAGRYIVEGVWEGIKGAYDWISEKISGWCEDIWGEFTSFFSGDGESGVINVGVKLIKSGWSSVSNWFGKIPSLSQAITLAKSGWSTVKGWIGNIPAVSQAVSLAKKGWSTVKGWVGNIPSVTQLVKLGKSGWSTVKKWVGSIPAVSQAVKLTKSGWSTVKKWVGSIPTMSAGIKLVKSGWTSVKKWLGNLTFDIDFKLPKIKIEWGTKTVAGFTIKYPEKFTTYAKGGFPDLGELFVAREAGPEMVGRIGNKTTVANNDQIVDGISEGVYAAVVAAMNAVAGNNGNQAVNVYLDGKQITSAVEQRQRERGTRIMGSQVYSY